MSSEAEPSIRARPFIRVRPSSSESPRRCRYPSGASRCPWGISTRVRPCPSESVWVRPSPSESSPSESEEMPRPRVWLVKLVKRVESAESVKWSNRLRARVQAVPVVITAVLIRFWRWCIARNCKDSKSWFTIFIIFIIFIILINSGLVASVAPHALVPLLTNAVEFGLDIIIILLLYYYYYIVIIIIIIIRLLCCCAGNQGLRSRS